MERGIYKIVNPEGKVYIGLSKNIFLRWSHYKNSSSMGSNSLLKNSLKKYGYDKHIFEIKEYVEFQLNLTEQQNNKILRERERYWIDFYQSDTIGLNQNRGGCGTSKHSPESKQKISKALKGKPKPPNFGEKRSKDFYTEEWRKKLSESSKGKSRGKGISKNKGRVSPNKGKGKPILQYDLNMNLIQEYPTLTQASHSLQIPQPCISECLRGKHKTAGGFIFQYV
jgi:group I intron endonuclease